MHRFNLPPATAQISWKEFHSCSGEGKLITGKTENHIPIQFHCRGEYLQWICYPGPSSSWVIQNVLIIKPSFSGQANFTSLCAAFPCTIVYCTLYLMIQMRFAFSEHFCSLITFARAWKIPVTTQLRERQSEGKRAGDERRRGLGSIWAFFLKASFITASRDML